MTDPIRREDALASFPTDDRSPLWHYTGIRAAIEFVPAVDAVEVVRCRDCKHWSGRNDKPGEVTVIGYCDHQNHHIMPLNANWFCADGERRNESAD